MKKLVLGIIVLLLIGAGAFVYTSSGQPAAPAPTMIPAAAPAKTSGRIVAEGKVVPVQNAALSFQTGGLVDKVMVAAGDRVRAGQTLAQLETRQLELQLAEAEANLAAAQAKLNQLKRSPTAEDQAAAQQNLTSAQAAYDDLLHPSENELIALKADVDKTRAAVDQAQAAYDRVGGDSNPDAGMLPQRLQLQTAWLDYRKAEALYNTRLHASNAKVQQALAEVQTAKSQLAKLQPTADDLAASQANLNAAQAARDQSAEQLARAKLVAPFAGTVTSIDLRAGEYVTPGVALLRLGDLSQWQVETTDLTELNLVNVHEGTPVTLTFDAISGLEIPGTVSRMELYGENKQGDIVYTLIVRPDQHDERLQWNMTSQVNIEPAK